MNRGHEADRMASGRTAAKQTDAMGIHHVTRRCDWSSYEQEFVDGLRELRSDYGVSHVIYGDIVYPEHRASAERFAAAQG